MSEFQVLFEVKGLNLSVRGFHAIYATFNSWIPIRQIFPKQGGNSRLVGWNWFLCAGKLLCQGSEKLELIGECDCDWVAVARCWYRLLYSIFASDLCRPIVKIFAELVRNAIVVFCFSINTAWCSCRTVTFARISSNISICIFAAIINSQLFKSSMRTPNDV